MVTAAAPASGIQASEPRKTLDPSKSGGRDPPILSDPVTRKSDSELSDPSGLKSNYDDPKDTNTEASGPKDSKTNQPNTKSVYPQEIKPATPDIGQGAADTSGSTPRPESFDPKHATLQPVDSQDVKPHALDTYGKPEKAQGSGSIASRPDDPKADDSTSTYRYQPNDPADSSSNVDNSGIQRAKDLPPQAYKPHPSGPDTKDISSSEPQDVETASSPTGTTDSLSDQSRFTGKGAAISHPHKSPATDSEASDDDRSNLKDTHEEINIFRILPTKLLGSIKALSLSATSSDGTHFTPNDPEPDPTSRPTFFKYPQPDPDPSDGGNILKGDALAIHFPDEDLPAKSSDAPADLPGMTTSAGGSALLPQSLASDPRPAGSNNTEGPPSRTATADAPVSATVAARISGISGSISSSTSTAATSRRFDGGGFDDGGSQRQSDSIREQSSGATSFAPLSNVPTRARELLSWFCICTLPWLLVSF